MNGDKCKYCENIINDKQGYAHGEPFWTRGELSHPTYTWLCMDENGNIYLDDTDGNEISVQYCPMCGRKL